VIARRRAIYTIWTFRIQGMLMQASFESRGADQTSYVFHIRLCPSGGGELGGRLRARDVDGRIHGISEIVWLRWSEARNPTVASLRSQVHVALS
jgi:hypothetical protein